MSDNATTNEPVLLLRKDRQDVPAWLMSHQPGAPLDWEEFGRSRIVYYPGSGDDGHPLKLFSRAHTAHCFILADYFLEPELFVSQLAVSGDERRVIGYGTIDHGRTTPRKVWPGIIFSQRRLATAHREYEKQA